MTDKQFLILFKRHCRFFIKKGRITREDILFNLTKRDCPFKAKPGNGIIFDREVVSPYLGKNGKEVVHRYDSEPTFYEAMEHKWHHLIKEMKEIVNNL